MESAKKLEKPCEHLLDIARMVFKDSMGKVLGEPETIVQNLASLSPEEYRDCRKKIAELFGVYLRLLDRAVRSVQEGNEIIGEGGCES